MKSSATRRSATFASVVTEASAATTRSPSTFRPPTVKDALAPAAGDATENQSVSPRPLKRRCLSRRSTLTLEPRPELTPRQRQLDRAHVGRGEPVHERRSLVVGVDDRDVRPVAVLPRRDEPVAGDAAVPVTRERDVVEPGVRPTDAEA